MSESPKTEVEVLVDQLEELLAEPVLDAEDAYEVAVVAGGAKRLGADPAALADAEAWRKGAGAELIDELWEQVDSEPLLEALEAVSEGGASEEEMEEALFDVDDLIAAAIWCRKQAAVRTTAAKAEAIVRELPDMFLGVADLAQDLLKRREVAEELELYGYWLVIAESA